MLSSAIPTLVPLPFANSGTKNTIPTASQIGITPGAASLTDGFPPLTFTPIAAGGIPPAGADFNGILNLLSANTQWENAGGFYPYSSSFSTSIGGYPKGALLAMASGAGFWLSAAENNTVNPESGPSSNWIPMSPGAIQSGIYNYAADTGAANSYVVTLSPVPTSYVAGMKVSFVAGNSNTGTSALNVNGLGAKNITKNGTTLLVPGDILAGAVICVEYDGTEFQITNPAIVAATTSLVGVSRFGTNAEQLAGSLSTVGCTPAGLASGYNLGAAYVKLPGGLILQWGLDTTSLAPGASRVVTFPIAFPTAVAFVNASVQSATVNNALTIPFCVISVLASFTFTNNDVDSPIAAYRWLAIGY